MISLRFYSLMPFSLAFFHQSRFYCPFYNRICPLLLLCTYFSFAARRASVEFTAVRFDARRREARHEGLHVWEGQANGR